MSLLIPDNENAKNEGYKKGKNDFEKGRGEKGPELFSKVSLIAMFSPNLGSIMGVDNRQLYIDKWFEGYRSGYKDSQAIHNLISTHKNKSINSNTMSQQTSFSYQLELLEDLKSYLHGFQDRLAAVAGKYTEKVTAFSAAGMMSETFEDFMITCVEPTKSKIQELINQINDQDIPFVEKEITYLESH